MKYFKLYPNIKLVKYTKNSCLYNFTNGSMIKLNNQYSDIIDKFNNKNAIVQSHSPEFQILKSLENQNIGYFTNDSFSEDFENIHADLKGDIIPQNNFIKKAYIELGSDCNLNCIFCKEDSKLYRKTGCRKWTSYKKIITANKWDNILEDLSYLKCDALSFIGGNPLLRIDTIGDIINNSKKYGFNKFVIFTNGTYINDEIINVIKTNDITLNIQILSFNKDSLNEMGLGVSVLEEIEMNLAKLVSSKVNIRAQILVNKYNQDEIEDIIRILKDKYKINAINIDYIYNKPDNDYYSPKRVNEMYKRNFGIVTINKFDYLQKWNSCLKGQVVIREDGEMLVCPMIRKSFGNVMERDICDLIKDKEYVDYTKITARSIDKCSECSYQYNCVDCRAIEASATNNLYGLEFCDNKV